ncbi:MAG: hypothetical protein HC905_28100 [Bacteroidales bacterium]|nr:hypothetical protein [Bacteroidales bacterium]
MKQNLAFLFSILPMISFSQTTTLVIKEKGETYEEYFVLTSDRKIKHGSYVNYTVSLFWKIFINETGNYFFNEKDSIWTIYQNNQVIEKTTYNKGKLHGQYSSYYPDSLNWVMDKSLKNNRGLKNDSLQLYLIEPTVRSQIVGNYFDNMKTGIWSYYNPNGDLIFQYNYNDSAIVFCNENSTSLSIKKNDLSESTYLGGGKNGLIIEIIPLIAEYYMKTTDYTFQFSKPIINYSGSNERIALNFVYNKEFIKSLDSSILCFSFHINKQGKLQNLEVLESPFQRGKKRR